MVLSGQLDWDGNRNKLWNLLTHPAVPAPPPSLSLSMKVLILQSRITYFVYFYMYFMTSKSFIYSFARYHHASIVTAVNFDL